MNDRQWQRFRVEHPSPGVALVTMCRPEKLNAMDQLWFAELPQIMGRFGVDGDETRAVVLTGEGRAFSAGGDIDMFADLAGDVGRVRPHLRRVYDAFCSVERCAVPVVAAVRGIAYGGGTELTLACDIALAGSSARFCFKEASVGLMPGYGIVRGPQVMGRHWTRLLAFTGRIIDPGLAQQAGLVQEVHDDGSVVDQALALAGEIAQQSPLAVQVGKAFINRDVDGGFLESVEATALLFSTPQHSEAVATFRAKGR